MSEKKTRLEAAQKPFQVVREKREESKKHLNCPEALYTSGTNIHLNAYK